MTDSEVFASGCELVHGFTRADVSQGIRIHIGTFPAIIFKLFAIRLGSVLIFIHLRVTDKSACCSLFRYETKHELDYERKEKPKPITLTLGV